MVGLTAHDRSPFLFLWNTDARKWAKPGIFEPIAPDGRVTATISSAQKNSRHIFNYAMNALC